MVPGMTERERLAADVRRLEWLADARLGPRQIPSPPDRPAVLSGTRYSVPLGFCRRGFAMALDLSRRVPLIRPKSVWPHPGVVPGQEIS